LRGALLELSHLSSPAAHQDFHKKMRPGEKTLATRRDWVLQFGDCTRGKVGRRGIAGCGDIPQFPNKPIKDRILGIA